MQLDNNCSSSPVSNLRLPASTAQALGLLNRRWVPQLLYLLCQREARFSDLARALPAISRRVLTERLRELADEGLLHRAVAPGPPTRITYRLTIKGEGLRDALHLIDIWAANHR